MKKIYKFYLVLFVLCFVKIQNAYSQAPVLGPIQGSTIICIPASNAFTYSVSATNNPTSYNWTIFSQDGVATLSNPNAASTSVAFSIYFTYGTFTLTCYAQNGSGTSQPVIVVIKVFQTPSVTFSGANSFCQGSSASISASSTLFQSSSTTISWAPAIGLSSTSSTSVIANPPTTTNYTVLTSNGPCTSTNYFLVTVNPAPTVTAIFSPSVICKGETSTLTINGNASTYSVNNAPFSSPMNYSPTATTAYTINSTGTNGCHSASLTAILNVNTCAGINETERKPNWLNFYPNPNNGAFTIRSQSDQSVILINELGQKLRTLDLKTDSEIKITGLSPGVYFLVTDKEKIKIVVTP